MSTYDERKLVLRINVEIREDGHYGYSGPLTVNEQVEISPRSFLEVCKVLGLFHDLVESIKVQSPSADEAAST